MLRGKTSHVYQIHQPLGGFVGFCGWLPFAHQVEIFAQGSQESIAGNDFSKLKQLSVAGFFLNTIFNSEASQKNETIDTSILSTPVFLSHGSDDAWVSVDLGRQAARVLQQIQIPVRWHEFSGAEGEGHWVKELSLNVTGSNETFYMALIGYHRHQKTM